MTKLTELHIRPERSWEKLGELNPLIATIRLESDNATVETKLSPEVIHKLLMLCQTEIAAEAKRNVDEFVSTVLAIEQKSEPASITFAEKNGAPF